MLMKFKYLLQLRLKNVFNENIFDYLNFHVLKTGNLKALKRFSHTVISLEHTKWGTVEGKWTRIFRTKGEDLPNKL